MASILVIEDNAANVELMVYLLEAFGHQIVAAADGESGISAAREARPDLIVCDIQLPTIDGYEVARIIKDDAALRDIPLIAVTALAMVGDRDQILAAGFDGYISKPIDPETFVPQAEAFLVSSSEPVRPVINASPMVADIAPPPEPTGATILIVDDALLNSELMRSLLEPFGYAVLAASSVREALVLARNNRPELIISDLHMPEQDGFELLRLFKADPLLRDINIIIHSATIGSELDCRKALELGAVRCITRPLEPQLMLQEIESYLVRKSE